MGLGLLSWSWLCRSYF